MYGKSTGPALLICGLFMLAGLLAGNQAQAIPVLPPLQLPHHETISIDNFTGTDMQNLSVMPSGGARLDYGERVWGGEFKVDPDGTSQYDISVAAGLNGRYFVAWQDFRNDVEWNIYGQVFERGGKRIGSEIAVCTAPGNQWAPDVASDGNGNFLVAWEDRRASDIQIFAQRYDADGKKLGNEITVSTGPKYKGNVAACARPDGSFALAWRDDRSGNSNIWGRLLDNSGAPLAAEFSVSTGANYQDNPDVASDGEGRFLVVWPVQDGNDYRIEGQRFDSTGNKVGTLLIISSAQFSQYNPKARLDSKSNIIVAWTDARNYNTDKSDIYATRLDWNGNALGAPFAVASGQKDQGQPALAIDRRDNVLMIWSDNQLSTNRIGSRLFGPQGEPLGETQYLHSAWANYYKPSLTVDREDNFMAAWATYLQPASQATAAPLIQTFKTEGRLATQTFSPPNLVRWGSMGARMTLGNPSSSSIAFELSTDSGATWTAVPDNGSLSAAGGSPLKLRALFSTSDNLTTPVLNNITLSYTWNTPPSVSAPAAMTVKKGKEVTLPANGTDADFLDALSLTYTWNQTSGKALGLSNLTGRNLTFKPASAGTYTFTVVATDGFASSAPATVTLSVSEDKKAEPGLPLLPIVGAVVVVAVVIGILAAMMMRRKPTTVIQYQPPPAAPAPAAPPAVQYQPAPLGSATPMPQGSVGSATPMPQGSVGSATPMPQGSVGSATPMPQGSVGSATPMPQGSVGSATPMPQGVQPPPSVAPVPQAAPPVGPRPDPP